MTNKRVFLIVLDSFGVGEMPDAARYHDEGSNTLGSIRKHPAFSTPTMEKLGLFSLDGVEPPERPVSEMLGSFGRMTEASQGKDTTVGHWEIAGLISPKAFPTFTETGFPEEFIHRFEEKIGRKVLCNKAYSGTKVIMDYGQEHVRTGCPIVYTSADSVFQIAAHEEVIPLEELYEMCRTARETLTGDLGVGRVIARPFTGDYPDFVRTKHRHDYSVTPGSDTMLDCIRREGLDVISVGKINDIFAGKGVTRSIPTRDNDDGMAVTLKIQQEDFHGLCFVNLVDFDMVYGHRNNIEGYAAAATAFDRWLPGFMKAMRPEDILIITADHGCDPATPSTDHSREYTPMLISGAPIRAGVNIGTRDTFADIGTTVLDYLDVPGNISGKSFLAEVRK